MSIQNKKILSKEFDKKFHEGSDLSEHVDWKNAIKRINLDIPLWALQELDKESSRRGITRQSLVKTWIIDRIDQIKATKNKVT